MTNPIAWRDHRHFTLWQDGALVANIQAPTPERARDKVIEYALIYSEFGAVRLALGCEKKADLCDLRRRA